MKKLIWCLLLTMCVGLMTACGSSSSETTTTAAAGDGTESAAAEDDGADGVEVAEALGDETFNYIMGHGAAENSIGDLYCKKFEELVEAMSGGSITVDVYSNSQLGTYNEMAVSLSSGDIGGMIFQPSPIVSIIPELAVLDIPYATLGKTQEQIDQALNDSEWTDLLVTALENNGYHFVSITQAATYREVTSNVELRTLEDFQGLNIRTLENNNHIAFWEAIGANPTPLSFNDLYLSLQQGLVDAQENPYDTSYAANFQEVQSYLVETHHILYPNLFIVSKDIYESMPEAYQAVFDEAAAQAEEYATELMAESNDTFRQQMADAGMEIIELDDDVLQSLSDAGRPAAEAKVRETLGDEVVDAFLNALE